MRNIKQMGFSGEELVDSELEDFEPSELFHKDIRALPIIYRKLNVIRARVIG